MRPTNITHFTRHVKEMKVRETMAQSRTMQRLLPYHSDFVVLDRLYTRGKRWSSLVSPSATDTDLVR
jgi:hypothetical protein